MQSLLSAKTTQLALCNHIQWLYLIKYTNPINTKTGFNCNASTFDGNGQAITYSEHAQINPLVLV